MKSAAKIQWLSMDYTQEKPPAHLGLTDVFIVIAAGILKFSILNKGLVIYDVGEVTFYIEKILSGQVAGLDYVVNSYGFGRYLLFSGLFSIFGKSLTVLNTFWILTQTASVFIALRIARRFLPGPLAVASILPFLFVPGPLHKSFFVFFTLAGALAAIRFCEKPKRPLVWQYAAINFLAALARPDLGVILAVGFAFALFVKRKDLDRSAAIHHGLLVTLPLFALAAAVSAILAFKGVLAPVVEQLLDELGKNTSITEPSFPSPLAIFNPHGRGIEAAMIYFYLMAYVAAIGSVLTGWPQKKGSKESVLLSILIAFGLMACNQVNIKPDFSHILQSAPISYVVAVSICYLIYMKLGAAGAIKRGIGSVVLVIGLILVVGLTTSNTLVNHPGDPYTGAVTNRWNRTKALNAGGTTIWLTPEEYKKTGAVLDFIAGESSGCHRLFVPTNQPMYYFLTGKKDVSGYPSVVFYAYNENKQRQVIQRLNDLPPVYVLYVDDTIEGDYMRLKNAAPLVYQYIIENYEPDKVFGEMNILKRKGKKNGKNGC